MAETLNERCRSLLTDLGLMSGGDTFTVEPLSGGVASDIAKVSVKGVSYCVKFALAKLRVKADWFAPVERNLAEYRWLQTVAEIAPEAAVRLYGHSTRDHGFVMEYLSSPDSYLFKTALLAGQGKACDASAVGDLLGRVHAFSASPDFDRGPFRNSDDFHAIRIEPYLVHTSRVHPALKPAMDAVADQLYAAGEVLIHGDVSPKNIIIHDGRPYMLDAECATMGDPCFDAAFCLNHFILKSLHVRPRSKDYLEFCTGFWKSYSRSVGWEPLDGLEARVARLLPMLMLGRVDGKSPVEYLSDDNRDLVRRLATNLVLDPRPTICELLTVIRGELDQ